MIIWFTGLPGSGKTTLALGIEKVLQQRGFKTFLLDGDALRAGLNSDLGFSQEDRSENVRRAAEVARLLEQSGLVVLATFITPFERDRVRVREIAGPHFIEVFVNCPLAICEKRDPKGLYKKARVGTLKEFTGISSPYEIPDNPDIEISTSPQSTEESVTQLQKELIVRLG